ncbi:MAG: SDR family oxidoreductase [Rubrivivax sp.]|nr:SDR family oxidoreductase [Rubrivivax sp.]
MLVTGASRGIGAAIARAAGAAGYRVGVNYLRSAAAAEAVVADIRAAGGEAVPLQADVGDPAQVERLFAELDSRLGRIDVLVNNAGILASFRVDALDHAQVAAVFRANVFSIFHCAGEAVRRMSTAHGGAGGVIVNLSSVAARLGGLAGGAAYAASKGAIDTFTLALAKEVGREGIRVAALRPGLIETEIHDVHGGLERMRTMAREAVPMGRSGTAEEVAQAALWLASAAASYVHGAVIDVAGGR